MKKVGIQAMTSLARARRGRCISTLYVNSTTPLLWQCELGHQWSAIPVSIQKGSWCPDCAGARRLTLEQMQQMAESRGGRCLSESYENTATKLEWHCSAGHQWNATPQQIKKGHWCPFCARVARLTLHELQRIALQKAGECLSLEYLNSSKPLRWKCAVSHEWLARSSSVKAGSWCPRCAHNQELKLEEMQEIAKQRGGQCLSASYKNGHTPLLWVCKNGHYWKASPANVKTGTQKKGTWCRECYNWRRRVHAKHSVEAMRDLAIARGGTCLSTEYVSSKAKLNWQCVAGHRWQALPTLFFILSHGKPDPGGVPILTRDLLIVTSDTPYSRPREHSISVAHDLVPYFRLTPVFAFLDTCFSGSAKNLDVRISQSLAEEYGLMVMASSLSEEQSYQATFTEALIDFWNQKSSGTSCTSPSRSASTLHKFIQRRLASQQLGRTEGIPEVVVPFSGDFCMESFGADSGLIVLFNTMPQHLSAVINKNDEEPIDLSTNQVVPYKLTRNTYQLDVFDRNNVRLLDEPVDLKTEPVVFKLFGAASAKVLGDAYLKAGDYARLAGLPREQTEAYNKRAFASFIADDEYKRASTVASALRIETVPSDQNWQSAFALSLDHRNQSQEHGKGWRFGPGGVKTETDRERVLESQIGPAQLAKLEKLAGDFEMAGALYEKVAPQNRNFAFQAYFAYGAAYQPEDAQRIRNRYELSFGGDCPESEQAAIHENSPTANQKFASLSLVRALAHLDYQDTGYILPKTFNPRLARLLPSLRASRLQP